MDRDYRKETGSGKETFPFQLSKLNINFCYSEVDRNLLLIFALERSCSLHMKRLIRLSPVLMPGFEKNVRRFVIRPNIRHFHQSDFGKSGETEESCGFLPSLIWSFSIIGLRQTPKSH